MPVEIYDPLFGGNAEKALRRMIDQYGEQKGRRVFYSMAADRKKQGHGLRKVLADRDRR